MMPSTDVRNQLSDITQSLSGQMIGPAEATQAREAYKQQLLQPYQQAGTRPRTIAALNDQAQTPPSLQDKIVFRDPIQDQLKLYQAHFGTMAAGRLAAEQSREEAAQKRQDALFDQQNKIKTRGIELELIGKYGASPQVASELSRYLMGQIDEGDLSEESQQFRSDQSKKAKAQIDELEARAKKDQAQAVKAARVKAQTPSNQMFEIVSPDGSVSSPMKLKEIRLYKGKPIGYAPGSQIRPVQQPATQPKVFQGISGQNPQYGFPLAPGGQGGPPLNRAPQGQMNFNLNQPQQPQRPLSPKQRETFNDIKRSRPDLTDEQVKTYMRSKGWLQ
jgi:hypothetical protein